VARRTSERFRGIESFSRSKGYHSASNTQSFEEEIIAELRKGANRHHRSVHRATRKLQATYSERICRRIFNDGMLRFISNEAANFVQLYFEEAHNLFPKKDDKDLSQIYNRLAKEGAKLAIGDWCTRRRKSVPSQSNVLKNTQNWFVSHLNNQDELKEVQKFYDFEDFVESLRRCTRQGVLFRMKDVFKRFHSAGPD